MDCGSPTIAAIGMTGTEHGVFVLLKSVIRPTHENVCEFHVSALGPICEETNCGVIVVENIGHAAP